VEEAPKESHRFADRRPTFALSEIKVQRTSRNAATIGFTIGTE
jgi:hypothetical protein